MNDLINRQEAIEVIEELVSTMSVCVSMEECKGMNWMKQRAIAAIGELPTAEPEKENAKRVLWTGWKGFRDTRYKCPNCKKPVKNDDVYCHRCGQRLMFPKVSHTPYVEGQKQEVIVRWDDE